MDTLTHLVAGALTPLAFRNAPKSRLLIPFGILCGEFPDVDVLAGNSPEALLVIHRGLTHALAVQPFTALILALLFHSALKKRDVAGTWSFGKTWLLAFLALLGHLFLDCMTTFGTQIFLPFSSYRVSMPAMYIIDLSLTLPLLALLIVLLRRGGSAAPVKNRISLARRGLAWMLIYPFIALGIGQTTQHYLASRYVGSADPGGIQRIMVTPEPFAPFYWKVVGQTKDGYLMSSVLLPRVREDLTFREYPRVDPALWQRLQAEVPLFAAYARFVSFPTQGAKLQDDGTTLLSFRDLRYEGTLAGLVKTLGRDDGLFIMQAMLDRGGKLMTYRFLRRGKMVDTPWETMPSAIAQGR